MSPPSHKLRRSSAHAGATAASLGMPAMKRQPVGDDASSRSHVRPVESVRRAPPDGTGDASTVRAVDWPIRNGAPGAVLITMWPGPSRAMSHAVLAMPEERLKG